MGKRIITEFELKNILNKNAARIAESIKAGEEELAKGGSKTLDEVLKKGPKQ